MLVFCFWVSFFTVIYVYLGYPVLIALLAKKAGRSISQILSDVSKIDREMDELPSVSILIAAYNEEAFISATLKNKLALDYPKNKLEILVVSDESSDNTDQLVLDIAATANIPVRLIRQISRAGKTAGLNKLVPEASGEIIAFCDANSLWDKKALSYLVSNFLNSDVGYVTGKMIYTNPDGSFVGDGCSGYMKYENWLRAKETLVGSIVGVDGGIDAMRKDLYQPLNADQLPDFIQPLKVVEKGFRVIYDSRAILKEDALIESLAEYRMRVRVSLRAIWALNDMSHLFNPRNYGLFSFQLFSHKLLRYLAFIPLLLLLILNAMLLGQGDVYSMFFVGQLLFYLFAYLGYKDFLRSFNVLKFPYYFILLNAASAHAFIKFCRGKKQVLWSPRVG
jgi:cellulose synthase/poly-beta-1,6-N-acetylglucosamine synthase-like glycosyltransferase